MLASSVEKEVRVECRGTLKGLDPSAWNRLVGNRDPFCEYEFLEALEASAAVGDGTGWRPAYVCLFRGDELVAAAPMYRKSNSYGEFVFDWAWAEAYERAGLWYYPKGVVGVPFTPVTGPRLLVGQANEAGALRRGLLQAIQELAGELGLSGLHVLFHTEDEAHALAEAGFVERLGYQFHWTNRGYGAFADFLADLRSSKRKQIRKERRRLQDAGISIHVLAGDAIGEEHIEAMWRFYLHNAEGRWSQPYWNRETFRLVGEQCRPRLLLVLARAAGEWVGGALLLRKADALYGRYWGCTRPIPGLHFECCYYRPIEFAIEHGITLYEAGAQGEHKFLRGFAARPVRSAHFLRDPRGHDAVRRFVVAEKRSIEELIRRYNEVSPLKPVRRGGSSH